MKLHESTSVRRDPSKLTPREQEALKMFRRLESSYAVASELGVKPATIRERLATIRSKLNVRSNAELLNMEKNNGNS